MQFTITDATFSNREIRRRIVRFTEGRQIFHKAYPVPFRLTYVGEEICRLVKDGLLYSIQYREWASPVVTLPDTDGKFDRVLTVGSQLQ